MSWTTHKKKLSQLAPESLISLVGDLYKLNSANRAFIEARLSDADEHGHSDYKQAITAAFNPSWIEPLRLKDARKAISDFRKARPDDLWGRINLMIHYIEQGTEYIIRHGDIDEGLNGSLCSMLDSILKVCHGLTSSQFQCCRERICLVETIYGGRVGREYADHLADVSEQLEAVQPVEDQ